MAAVETGRVAGGLHTVAVFKDLEWARRGVAELRRNDFPPEAMSVIAKPGEGVADWAAGVLGAAVPAVTLPRLGEVLAAGPLVEALDGGAGRFGRGGLAATANAAGFQPHDGQIFETLVERGGILVAVRSEPRAPTRWPSSIPSGAPTPPSAPGPAASDNCRPLGSGL
jgi:hypothetical protein